MRLKSLLMRYGFVMVMLTIVAGSLCVAFKIQRVKGLGRVYIHADGSIDPPFFGHISSVDNVTYTFTGNVTNLSVVVERDDIVIDGAGYTIQGPYYGPGYPWYTAGVDLVGRENVTVMNLKIKAFTVGVRVEMSSNVFIFGNNITGNDYAGIHVYNCSKSNTFSGNHLADSRVHGIYLEDSSDQVLCENVADSNGYGISMDYSSNNILYGNVISNNSQCFYIFGFEPRHFIHSIDVSNLVNGKPVYYLVNQNNLGLTSVTHPHVGYLALANCTNITVDGLSFVDTLLALTLAYTSNSTITNSVITDTIGPTENRFVNGVMLMSSYNNTFARNNITKNSIGMWLINSSCNILSANNIKDNLRGVMFYDSSANNTFVGNNIANNDVGIVFEEESRNNSLYHNNFTDNLEHVRLSSSSGPNFWDDGYPSGGNYWSGYSDTDMYSGPYQNETGSDGIWDHSYVIDEENQDNYPTISELSTPLMLLAPMILTFTIIAVHQKKRKKQCNVPNLAFSP